MRSKNKLVITMLVILVSITLIGVIVLVVSNQLAKGGEKEEETLSAAERVEATVEVPEVTTNIAGNNFARVSLYVETDSKKAAEELKLLEFQVKDMLIEELTTLTKQELESDEGKEILKNNLTSKMNDLLQEGEVIDIYLTSFVVQ
ncbi:flagellar basal body-associated FliL family protein [Jeotgalibacillus sp. JSM ZJ347]|uniref:flagellar basal body-associated FliL family protein n=1 Tax=Jeotgalibacillus sp. JSM ZJ347 TaxID=3342117 RepID=UPI0035A8F8EC